MIMRGNFPKCESHPLKSEDMVKMNESKTQRIESKTHIFKKKKHRMALRVFVTVC